MNIELLEILKKSEEQRWKHSNSFQKAGKTII